MAQTGYTPIQLYRSTTASAVPSASNLNPGELAININDADMALYAENASGTVKKIMNNPAGLTYPTADGTGGQVMTTDGAGNVTFTSTLNVTTVNATTVDTTNIEVTNIKAKDGTSAGSIANSTGVVTLASSVLTTTDINGGTIDGAVIGGSSSAAGTFTTVTASGDVTIADKIVHSGDTNTAIRFPAADTVTVETSGAERLRVDSSGNVGVGISSPASRLSVAESNTDNVTFGLWNTSAYGSGSQLSRIQLGKIEGVTYQPMSEIVSGPDSNASSNSGYFLVRTRAAGSTTERMRIDSSGNLLVGTTTAVGKVTVDSSSPLLMRLRNSDAASYTSLRLYNDVNSNLRSLEINYVGSTASGGERAELGTTGAYPLTFLTNNTERLRLDSSGNLGLGVTPSAWSSFYRAFQLPSIGIMSGLDANSSANYLNNSFFNGTNFIYRGNGAAARYEQAAGVHAFYNAPSGTAGNAITFTQAMTLDASGRLALGATSANERMMVASSGSASYIQICDSSTGTTSGDGLFLGSFAGAAELKTKENNSLAFGTNNTERARIDASGNLLVGTTTASGKITLRTDSTSAQPFIDIVNRAQGSGFVQGGIRFASFRDVRDPSYAAAIWSYQEEATAGNAAALVFGTRENADENLPTERMRIDSSGNLMVGTTSNSPVDVSADGVKLGGAGYIVNVQGFQKAAVAFGRASNTGGMVDFYYRGASTVPVGSITTNGTTTAYNTSSDYRLKENVAPMQNALDTVAQLNPVTYTWKADGSAGQGFIAHELQAVVPDCVTGEKDAVDETGNPQYQGVDTSFLVATLVKAIQELKAEVDSLRAQLNP